MVSTALRKGPILTCSTVKRIFAKYSFGNTVNHITIKSELEPKVIRLENLKLENIIVSLLVVSATR